METQYQTQIKNLKDELDFFKKRVMSIEKEKQEAFKAKEEANESLVNAMRLEFKQQLEKCEQERLKSLSDLEKELVKQRERTLKLLAEKDAELERFKHGTGASLLLKKSPSRQIDDDQHDETTEEENNDEHFSDDLDDAFNEKLNAFSNSKHAIANNGCGNESEPTRLLYFNEQNAYKDMELNKLRVLKSDLEYKLKQTNDEHSVDIDRLQNQISILKQEIERLKLNHSRNELNGANLEYIKNVVFNFMTTKDQNVKLSMANAITQILQFSKNEKQRLQSLSNKLQ